jgi:hypothetical protein
LVGKDRARCLFPGPSPHPPRENRAYGFHHTTAHAGRASVGSSFTGFSRYIPPDSHPVSCPTTTASRLRRFPLYAALPRSSGGASLPRVHPPIRHLASAGFWSLLGAFPKGRFPFRGLFRLGPRRIRPGSPLAYSPLSFASRARLPVSSTRDSATWGRWWFAAIPYRALRLPAWKRGRARWTLSTFQWTHVMPTVGFLSHWVWNKRLPYQVW